MRQRTDAAQWHCASCLIERRDVKKPQPLLPEMKTAQLAAVGPDGVATEAFEWPAPPFHQRSAGSPVEQDGETDLEFADGHVQSGELISIRSDGRALLRRQGQDSLLDLAGVRVVRLKKTLAFVPDSGALLDIGTSVAQVAEEKTFTISHPDGTKFEGTTRGFLKCSHGLHLFLAASVPGQTISCFVPRPQIKDVRIGPPLGETLKEKGLVTEPALAAALTQQLQLRQELLGEYLTGRAIVSVQALTQALQHQKKQPNVRLGDLLVEEELITPGELAEALAVQSEHRGRRLGDILVSMGAVSLRVIQRALSDKLGIPYVNVREFTIDPLILGLVEGPFAVAHQVLPLQRHGRSLVIATENPLAGDYEKDLRFMTGLDIVPVIADTAELRARIAREYMSDDAGHEAVPRELEQVKVEALALQLSRKLPPAGRPAKVIEAERSVNENTLVRLVNKIIIDAHAQGASDIHIEANPGRGSTRVRFRKDGELVNYLELQASFRNALVSRIKIMAGLDISEHRLAQDGKINFGRLSSLAIELRVAIIPTTDNLEDVVLRILGGAEPIPLAQLGMMERDLTELKTLIGRSHGLFLVCGPTGSGKTTTLHSALAHINRPDMKIWTAEDPIEITQPGLRQVQVNPKIEWTFAAALRSFLRADPDVIMVGEMRDADTARTGIEASLTGHLVLSTLHTNSAAESVTRLLNLGMDPFNFADSLLGVLSQRLARKLCPHCKRSHLASSAELANLVDEYCAGTRLEPAAVLEQWRKQFGDAAQLKLYRAVGCAKCSHGYKGRLGVYELLVTSPQIRQLISKGATAPQLAEAAQAGGMHLLKQDALLKVLSGAIDLASARAVSA